MLGIFFAVLLHEETHLIVMVYYKIPLKAIVLTKWSAIGFLVDNESYVTSNTKLFFLHFLPLVWCFLIFINPQDPFFIVFPVVNIFGGIGDFYNFFKLFLIPPDKRIELADKDDAKVLSKIIWRKDIPSAKKSLKGNNPNTPVP